ncbi:MAG: DNA topoisomerase III, partial [Clostridiales bacterium]|nr:DNA topoisomerase III [Clostridiales bacterium]
MILIIAEKPSLARSIAAALGSKMTKGDGFISVGGYIVTWAFGHLFSLADVEYYNPNPDGKWTLKNLPCFPSEFHYELRKSNKKDDAGIARQFNIIRSLCNRPDVDTIVNAGDSDREGEIIVRLCIQNSFDSKENIFGTHNSRRRLARLWLPDQTPETIQAAVAGLRDESEFDTLANEGFARTYIDWLYGVNLTRYATLKSGTLMRVGRVIVPIVKAIYDRDLAIRNFVPEKYYAIVSNAATNGEQIELTSKLKFDKKQLAEATAKCAEYNSYGGIVLSSKRKKDKLNPGKLWSLTKLQSFLGKKYKMSMPQSLEIVQGLYEKGLVTYPRTNSEYLATAEKDKVKKVLTAVGGLGYPVKFKEGKSIFDDSKIESHSALTPTTKMPDKSKLTPDEIKVYGAIIRRFVAVFCAEDCVVDKTELVIRVGTPTEAGSKLVRGEDFTLKGMVIIEPGWTKYDDYNKNDKVLPKLKTGERVNVDFKPVEKETTPPKHYTIETLNNYLKNPFRDELAAAKNADKPENEDDSEEYRAVFEGLELGTEATRTSIIDNARASNYISLKKDVYTILPTGEFLIESLSRMGIGMDKYKTAELGKALKRVFRGESTIEESVKLAEAEISEVFARVSDDGFAGDEVGKCPVCGRKVVRGRYGYQCSNWRGGCKFKIGSPILGATVSLDNARKLLTDGKTEL